LTTCFFAGLVVLRKGLANLARLVILRFYLLLKLKGFSTSPIASIKFNQTSLLFNQKNLVRMETPYETKKAAISKKSFLLKKP
jgi:hypothetical protein